MKKLKDHRYPFCFLLPCSLKYKLVWDCRTEKEVWSAIFSMSEVYFRDFDT